jgi:GNAT superfamily N-acetyltransferase
VAQLDEVVDQQWAVMLGCAVELLHEPGVHLVAGGVDLKDQGNVHLVHVDESTMVYCPNRLRDRALEVLDETAAESTFNAKVCAKLADVARDSVAGPFWHGFVDGEQFDHTATQEGRWLRADDALLDEFRETCGRDAWVHGGFTSPGALIYGIESGGVLVAGGTLTTWRGPASDIQVVVSPTTRKRGLAAKLAARMAVDVLPHVKVMRWRILAGDTAAVKVATSLGFVEQGRSYVAHLPR